MARCEYRGADLDEGLQLIEMCGGTAMDLLYSASVSISTYSWLTHTNHTPLYSRIKPYLSEAVIASISSNRPFADTWPILRYVALNLWKTHPEIPQGQFLYSSFFDLY